jgi:hypothetical protein
MYLNMLNSAVGVSLLLKSRPVLVASNTWKTGAGLFLELHAFIIKNKKKI